MTDRLSPPIRLRRPGELPLITDAPSMLSIYLVLLLAVPSNLTIGGLASFGRPSLLWGLLMALWWLLTRLHSPLVEIVPVRQPVRFAFGCVLVIALLSFGAALLRGQPPDQISPATSGLIRLISWG